MCNLIQTGPHTAKAIIATSGFSPQCRVKWPKYLHMQSILLSFNLS